ncbi:MAG: hypothetical protein LBQ91_06820 [Oscillospiraceae bacterium]|jgi:hypothetical protein|nr:hypothetical protein [Oscillospiraceae bacterium]
MNQPWSKIRQRLENECLCEALKGRIRYFTTRYRNAHDGTGRVCILVDNDEKLNMPFETEYKISAEVYRRNDKDKSLKERYDEVTGEFHEKGIFEPWDFSRALDEYFICNIEDCLKSDNPLVRLLAVLDRRTGKRTLEQMKTEAGELPDWLRYFYYLRLTSEGIK